MKTWSISVIFALCLASLIALPSSPATVEAEILRVQLEAQLPVQAAQLGEQPLEIQALLVDYAPQPLLAGKASLALLRYPAMARNILSRYGDETEFQRILLDYGELVLPPIQYFLDHESRWLQTQQDALRLVERMQSVWASARGEPTENTTAADRLPEKISAEQRGWYAIAAISADGHDFLGQFELDEHGAVKRIRSEQVLENLSTFFASGIRSLETKWQRGETLAAADAGWAAVDLLVGVSALKVLRLGRTTAKSTRALSFSQRNAALGAALLRGSQFGLRLAQYGAPLALGYIALKHPAVLKALIADAARFVAEHSSLPRPLLEVTLWTLLLLPLVLITARLLRPLAWLLSHCVHLLRWLHIAIVRKPV